MKKLYISLVLTLIVITTFAQTPNISMTTTLSINSQISFTIRGNSSSTPIQIDWGNGTKESYTIGDMDEAFGFPVKGSTIKIWGQGVEGLNIQSKELTAMEFYQAASFKTLFCKGNKLTTLNLNDCPALTLVECKENQISSLTLPNTTTLTYVDCSDNNLTLASLPVKQGSWTTYIYSPQKEYKLSKTVYAVNEEIDLSSQLSINGNTTTFIWKTTGGTTLINGTDYSVIDGKFTFLKTYSESIYCEMANASLANLTLTSVSIKIIPIPDFVMKTSTTLGSEFSFIVNSESNNNTIQVDWGNGILNDYMIGQYYSTISGTLQGNTIKIYGKNIWFFEVQAKKLNDLVISINNSLMYLICSQNQITNLDVSKSSSLFFLSCSDNKLTTLDVTNNPALNYLDCGFNKISTLDISKNTGLERLYCQYNQLSSLDVSNNIIICELLCNLNLIKSIDLQNNLKLKKLICHSNQLTSLDVSKNTELTYLWCSSNKLTNLDISKNTMITYFDCSSNNLASLDLSSNAVLSSIRCESNYFTFTNLPIAKPTWTTYTYSPQAKIKIEKQQYNLSESVDLSSQLTVNSNTTSYIWKTKGGITLSLGADYSVTSGVTTFLKGQTDSVYCQMTNATFPALTLSTTNIKVSDPTSIESDIEQITKVYPNPVSNLLWVMSEEAIKRVEIYTVVGIKVFEQEYNTTKKVNINATELPEGLLIIKVYGDKGVMEKKILKE